jgi:DNA-binding MarR family transcriptional regulator
MTCVIRNDAEARRAWQLLVKFFFAQRDRLPPLTDQFELSSVQCHVLHLIDPDHPLPMNQLAATLACDASNVTGLVDRLEARGLVRRQPSARDRRVKVIQLTPTGARLRAELLRRMTGDESCALSRLSASDQRALVRILQALLDRK